MFLGCSALSDSLRPHGPKHTRLPCPSPAPRTCSNSCPKSQWCPSNHLILCRPRLLLLSIVSSIRVFANESAVCIKIQEGTWMPLNAHPLLLGYVPVGNTYSYLLLWLFPFPQDFSFLTLEFFSKTSCWQIKMFLPPAFFLTQLSFPSYLSSNLGARS